MHEMSIALNIIDIAGEYAANANVSAVREIELEIGALAGIELEALTSALDTAKKGTILNDARTTIIPKKGVAKCLECNTEYEMDDFISCCPNCNKFNIEIISGKEMRVKSLIVD